MSMLRKRRREAGRQFAAAISTVETQRKAVRTVEAREEERYATAFAKAMCESMIMVLAFEHIDHHHTGAWLRKWLREFNAFGEAVRRSNEPIGALVEILKSECDFDFEEEVRQITEGME